MSDGQPIRTRREGAVPEVTPGRPGTSVIDLAIRRGLVREVITLEALRPAARGAVWLVQGGSPPLPAAIKEIVHEAEEVQFTDALTRVTRRRFAAVDRLCAMADQAAGARAFAEGARRFGRGARR